MDAENWEPLWRIPPEWSVDPMFEHELCLELGMSKAELYHGRGAVMSLRELYEWQLFFNTRGEIRAEQQREQAAEAERQRRRIS